MDKIKQLFRRTSYEPLAEEPREDGDESTTVQDDKIPFSWIDYATYFLLGIAMLWAWNMFLAAGPYFQTRFSTSPRILSHFQSAELSVSTLANLGSMLVLTNMQARASYPKRIISALVITTGTFVLLALSTRVHTSAGAYFAFLIVMVFLTSLATGLCQNGVFAFVSGFGRDEYTQGIMTGQAVAGVLPCIAQIVSVLSIPERHSDESAEKGTGADGKEAPQESWKSAFAYFLTATFISLITLLAFFLLLSRHRHDRIRKASLASSLATASGDDSTPNNPAEGETTSEPPTRTRIPLLTLFKKLRYLSLAVFLTFAITMVFPVFTQRIESIHSPSPSSPHSPSVPRIYHTPVFIPLAFLIWNLGDLLGRLSAASPRLRLTHRPILLFLLALCRIVFIPLYLLCNIRDRPGAPVMRSDAFYLVVVQLLFGLSNGFIGSMCMMGTAEWVEPGEREAAGGFMSLCLVGGLAVGSLLSFVVGGS
ncbi:hypothetical protein K402DRAFT_346813 [Aulographum hederae CBS 113979]|uniref:Nucleoside transporter family n=1 Tax=Aulographum hederae CBS 113979 TaxID=1176131 RepID=A0A6G1HD57_9PEZI|nr:hypothetical protein K402DRAFT_346813 [Aulographum hederae CBS 113979]